MIMLQNIDQQKCNFSYNNFRILPDIHKDIRLSLILGCPESVFLLQTRLLQRRIFIQT